MSHNPRPPFPMNNVAIESSALSQVAYDEQRTVLHVTFHNGAVFQYLGVPPQTYWGLLRAESKGAYFNHHIRNAFAGTKLRDATQVPSHLPTAPAPDLLG
jgi:KTSC domain